MRSRVRWGMVLGLVLAAVTARAQDASRPQPRTVPPEVLALIQDDDPFPLPRQLSAEERRRWRLPGLHAPLAPPAGPVRAQAEYEDNSGLLVRWGSMNALLTEMIVAITTGDPDALVYVVVTGSTQQNSASSILEGAGAVMSRVRFISQSCSGGGCSVWMRDYGPRFVDDHGRRGAIDHVYNRPRPVDDLFPGVWATYSGEPRYDIPLTHGGGNFHLFRNRDAFMTRLIVNENPGLTEQQIKDYYRDYQGLNLTLTDPFPASYDSTQHIDMWMLPLADDKVLVSQHASSDGVPYTVTEDTAALLAARGYTVYRTPAWRTSFAHYTYANAVLLNKLALVCQFDGYATQNAAALATFAQALPERSVVGVNCSDIIDLSGAIHCIVMHVPDLLFRNGMDD